MTRTKSNLKTIKQLIKIKAALGSIYLSFRDIEVLLENEVGSLSKVEDE